MGLGNSKDAEAAKYGQIYTKTDKSAYCGAETVTGRIYVNLKQPFPGKKIFLKFKGRETNHCVVREERLEDDQKTRRYEEVLYSRRYNIIKERVPVTEFNSHQSGQFVIPFAFVLPLGLANTFHQEGYRYLANISYLLEVIFEPDDKKKYPRLKYSQDLIVRTFQVQSMQAVPPQEVNAKITTCCCIPKGNTTMNVTFEKDWYSPEELAEIKVRVDNSASKLTIKNITFSLTQHLKIATQRLYVNRTIISSNADLPGIPKGGAPTGENDMVIKLPPLQDGTYKMANRRDMKSHLLSISENFKIMHCATKGKWVTSEYFLDVFCPMDACCCPTVPRCRLPIQIFHPETEFATVEAPTGWNPVQLSAVNLAMPQPAQLAIEMDKSMNQNKKTVPGYQVVPQSQ